MRKALTLAAASALLVLLSAAQTTSPPARPPQAPNAAASRDQTYDDTLRWIQERLSAHLEERGHCRFTYHSQFNTMFDAGDLARHVIWSKDQKTAEVSCYRGKPCVNARFNSWRFEPREGVDRQQIETAVLRLLELCNAVPESEVRFSSNK